MKHKAVAIRRKDEGDIESRGIFEALLHAVVDAMIVVFRLDDRERNIRLVIENEVGLLRLSAADQLSANDDSALW